MHSATKVLKRVAQKHPAYGIFMPRYVTVSQDMESIHVVLSTKQDSDNITIKPYAVRNFSDSAMIDLLFEMVNFDSFFEEGGDILSEVDDISQWFYYESISWCDPFSPASVLAWRPPRYAATTRSCPNSSTSST